MISNLRSSENAPAYDAAKEGARKAIASYYRDDSDTVFLDLLTIYVPILYLPTFVSQMREIFTFSWPGFPETTRLIPNISDEFPKTSERYRNLNVRRCSGRPWSTSEATQKTTILGCFDFVRTKKEHKVIMFLRIICPDLRVRREKLSSMREIDVFSPQAWWVYNVLKV